MFLADELILDAPRRTKEGYMAVRAKAARAGVYDYRGREIDPEGKHFAADALVKVYRPEDEVFAKDAVRSFLLKPITDDHPAQAVTADNWKQHAKGVNAGAMRDGEYLAFDLVLMDAGTIEAVESGKKELSNGYQCEIEVGDGTAPDGTAYQATQRSIRGNHVAVVQKGRAGPECRIGDVAVCDAITLADLLADERTYNGGPDNDKNNPARRETSTIPGEGGAPFQDGDLKMPHTLIIDGLQVPNVSDEAKAAIEKLQGQINTLTTDKAAAETKVGELTATISTKDGEIAALNQKVTDAAITPERLEQMVTDRAALITQAKAIHPAIVTDGKTEAEIRKAVVEAKLGDAAKDMDEAAVGGAFKVLAKDVKQTDPVRAALADGVKSQTPDATIADAYNSMVTEMADAWKPQQAA